MTGGDATRGIVRGYRGRLLIGVSGTWFVVMTAQHLLPPLLPAIIDDFGVSLTAAGVMFTVVQAGNALVQYPSGRLSDQWSRASLIVPGLVGFVIGVLLIGIAPTFAVAVLGAAVFGLGKGLYNSPVRALLSDHFVARRGRALGIFTASYDLGGLAASGIAVATLAVASWRVPFLGIALLVLVLGVLYVHGNREPITVEPPRLAIASTARRILRTPGQRDTVAAYTLVVFVTYSVLTFLPAYLQAEKGFSPALASTGFAALFAVGVVSKSIAGDLSDRVPRWAVSIGGLVVAIASLGALVVLDSTIGVFAAIVAYALGTKPQYPLFDAIVMDTAPDGNVGGDLGAARTVFFGLGGFGAAYTGLAADRVGFRVAFLSLVAGLIVAALLLARRRAA